MRSQRRSDEEVERLMRLSDDMPTDLEELSARLSDPDHLVRHVAAAKLAQLEDSRAVDPLIGALGDQHPEVRSVAAVSLYHYADVRSLPTVLDHLANDSSPRVRSVCANTAGWTGTDAAMEALRTALADPDEHVRFAACFQFAHRKDLRAVHEIEGLLNDSESLVRDAAACVLVRLRGADERITDLLAHDPSWEVRKDLALELIRAGIADQRIVAAIERLMVGPEAEEYEEGVAAYQALVEHERLDSPGPESEDDEPMSEEEEAEMLRTLEEMSDKPLAEYLAQARRLLEDD